jgi:hypothetical protein
MYLFRFGFNVVVVQVQVLVQERVQVRYSVLARYEVRVPGTGTKVLVVVRSSTLQHYTRPLSQNVCKTLAEDSNLH